MSLWQPLITSWLVGPLLRRFEKTLGIHAEKEKLCIRSAYTAFLEGFTQARRRGSTPLASKCLILWHLGAIGGSAGLRFERYLKMSHSFRHGEAQISVQNPLRRLGRHGL